MLRPEDIISYASGRNENNSLLSVDTRKGLCFAVIRNDVCQAVTKKMMKIQKKECCCTAGKAWGTRCERCPSSGTGISVLGLFDILFLL